MAKPNSKTVEDIVNKLANDVLDCADNIKRGNEFVGEFNKLEQAKRTEIRDLKQVRKEK